MLFLPLAPVASALSALFFAVTALCVRLLSRGCFGFCTLAVGTRVLGRLPFMGCVACAPFQHRRLTPQSSGTPRWCASPLTFDDQNSTKTQSGQGFTKIPMKLFCRLFKRTQLSLRVFQRFLPTGVGNTLDCRVRFSAYSVHPHGRGEHKYCQCVCYGSHGSSPRAWGTHLYLEPIPVGM